MNSKQMKALQGIMKSFNKPINAMNMKPVVENKPTRPSRKCLLPECNNQTTHNGGYCCADHCKQHNELRKAKQGESK